MTGNPYPVVRTAEEVERAWKAGAEFVYDTREGDETMTSAEEILARRYATDVLTNLTAGQLHFNELKETLHTATSKSLSLLLKMMTSEGVLSRTELAKSRVVYALTEKGRDLVQVIELLRQWEMKWDGGGRGG